MDRIDAAIAERARQQLSLITFDQLDAIGCTRQMRRTRIDKGLLEPVGHRVLRIAGVAVTWEQMVLAAQYDAGPQSVLSHMSAAALWGFAGIRQGAIELSVPRSRRPSIVRGRLHRVDDLDPSDVRDKGLHRLTSPERTLVDIAGRLRASQLEEVLDSAARDGLLSAESVAATLGRLRRQGRKGVRRLDGVLGAAAGAPRADSWLERKLLDVISKAGLPKPRTQVVLDPGTGRLARVDVFFDGCDLVVEADGHRTHSTRRDRQADAEREAALVARGCRVIRFTYEDVTGRPGYVARTLRLHLGQLGGLTPPPARVSGR